MNSADTTDKLDAMIARTALKYDLLPYQSKAFPQSHPSHLAAIAAIAGLEFTPPASARVLELGCASGGNIIPHAVRYPNARFVGVDLGRTQVATGRKRIAKLGLKNIEIHCQNFMDIGDELGSFDYIIAHGVFSWVPAPVQEMVLKIIRDRLSPTGLAFVSYNVLPGWRMLQPVRDAFLSQLPDNLNPVDRVAKARELLEFIKGATPDKGPYGELMRNWAARFIEMPDDYIEHEFLEDANEPCTFREFVTRAARHGLGYLAESNLSSMVLDNYGSDTAEKVRARTRNNLLESEQYIDVVSGRTFRQSVLIASNRMGKVDRMLSPEKVASLHFLSDPGLTVIQEGDRHIVSDPKGRTLTTNSRAVIAGIERLIAGYPWSSSLSDCVDAIPGKEKDRAAGRQGLLEALYRMTLVGMLTLFDEPISPRKASGVGPSALPLARADAVDGAPFTTNLRHENVHLDGATRALLPVMDGSLDERALAKRLTGEAMAGRISFMKEGSSMVGPDGIEKAVAEHLPVMLRRLADAGLLDGAANTKR
jgi:2-polyprenyl-3-methyl-5-hydroxy-6-metoxy-1,4-benzoquinol methylase/methyltransferase-like protein